jgi:hypothetical protein
MILNCMAILSLRPVDADDIVLHDKSGVGTVPADELPDCIQSGEPILLSEKSCIIDQDDVILDGMIEDTLQLLQDQFP